MTNIDLDSKERKRVSYPTGEILGSFFNALADNDTNALRKVHIPRSEVFYIREKYFQDTGHWISLDRMERSMYLEGMLKASDVKEPNRKREWELL